MQVQIPVAEQGVVVPQLARLRKRKALTQRELAERADVTQPVIVNGEKGRPIRLSSVRKLAEALGVEPADLMGAEA